MDLQNIVTPSADNVLMEVDSTVVYTANDGGLAQIFLAVEHIDGFDIMGAASRFANAVIAANKGTLLPMDECVKLIDRGISCAAENITDESRTTARRNDITEHIPEEPLANVLMLARNICSVPEGRKKMKQGRLQQLLRRAYYIHIDSPSMAMHGDVVLKELEKLNY